MVALLLVPHEKSIFTVYGLTCGCDKIKSKTKSRVQRSETLEIENAFNYLKIQSLEY